MAWHADHHWWLVVAAWTGAGAIAGQAHTNIVPQKNIFLKAGEPIAQGLGSAQRLESNHMKDRADACADRV